MIRLVFGPHISELTVEQAHVVADDLRRFVTSSTTGQIASITLPLVEAHEVITGTISHGAAQQLLIALCASIEQNTEAEA